jgi:maleate isomerase
MSDVAATIVLALRVELRADRVTLRLDTPGMNFPCAAESTGPGVKAISDDNSLDQRGAATASWIADTGRILVQPDVTRSDIPPPQALIDTYGVRAQMLAPVLVDGRLEGWISVHSRTERPWTAAQEAALSAAATEVAGKLDLIRAEPGFTRWLG